MNPSLPPLWMNIRVDDSLALVRQPVSENENSVFKPTSLSLKTDYVSHPTHGGGVEYILSPHLLVNVTSALMTKPIVSYVLLCTVRPEFSIICPFLRIIESDVAKITAAVGNSLKFFSLTGSLCDE